MPQIKNVEIHWARLDPEWPQPRFKKETRLDWSLEIRTEDPDVAEQWEDEFHLNVKRKTDDETGKKYYRANLRKLAIDLEKHGFKEFNTEAREQMFRPVEVLDPQLNELDGRTIGNGSIGNVMVRFREWEWGGDKGVSSDLQKVQILRLIPYIRDFEDFDQLDESLEVIEGSDSEPDFKNEEKTDAADLY